MTKEQAHGRASLSADCRVLTIKTESKRGKKLVPNVCLYVIEDLCPDKRVANPAYRLTKVEQVGVVGECPEEGMLPVGSPVYRSTGDVYDVAIDRFGPTCSCAHAIYRGHNNKIPCKHVLGMMAVQLLPRK